ncbi:Plastid-lipid-associated protein, chloroplastic [Linum grandiflorum]
MAATSSRLNHFPCRFRTLSITPQNTFFSTYSPPTVHLPAALTLQVSTTSKQFRNSRPHFLVRAVGEADAVSGPATVTVPDESDSEIEKLKKQLVDCFYGTDRGLRASSETRAEIGELITQLESNNPTPSPTDALPLLTGKWILSYTSFPGLFPLLARGTPSLLMVEEISQTIDSENFTVQNSVRFASPYATTSITTNAKFEVRSPKRVQVSLITFFFYLLLALGLEAHAGYL